MIVSPSYVSVLINIIVQRYHFEATSVCILWNDNFPFTLKQSNSGFYAVITSLHRQTFIEDENVTLSRLDLLSRFEEQLAGSIEQTHCESFIAFEEDIPLFANSFLKSALHSKWRSVRNKFLFVYTKDQLNVSSDFDQIFFKDLSNILFVEILNETLFNLKTTKFVGSRKDHPEELIFLDRYHGKTNSFEFKRNLYPNKLKNLEGRELIVATFSYEPFAVLKNATVTNVMDVANGNKDPSKRLLYDGTDAQFLFHLCGLYNCTVQVDSTEEEEWGYVYENYTADGVLGLVFDRKADICMIAMYMWYKNYLQLDMSGFLSRSGVTCLVPAPRRIISWLLPLEPFHWLLWLGIAGCLIMEGIGLLLTRWAGTTENISWTESAYFGFGTSLKLFVSQASSFIPSSVSVRIVLFSCYMIDIIISSIYSGGLASILTVPSLEEAADSFERLAKHNLIWTGTAFNWIIDINNTDEELMKRVLNNFRVYSPADIKQKPKLARTIGYAIESIQFGHFALPSYLDQEIMNNLKLMTDDIYYQYCVAFVPKPWPILEKFNNLVLMMQSSGLVQFLQWKVVADYLNINLQIQVQTSVKSNFGNIGPVKLGMENFVGIITILFVGIILSVLVFIGELLHYRLWRRMIFKNN